MKDKCPLCSGTDLLIYGTHTSPQGCGVCFANKNPDKWHDLKMKEAEEFRKILDEFVKEIKAKRGVKNE